jgi:hypothetical protein
MVTSFGAKLERINKMWKGDVVVVRRTYKAVLVNHENEEAWIPYSQIHDDSEIYEVSCEGEKGALVIPEWLAEKNGWL